MDGEQKADKNESAAGASAPAVIPKGNGAMPTAPATSEQLKQAEENIEERMSAFERQTIRLTRVSIGLSFVVGAAIIIQAVLMFLGGSDTHNLAVAAKNQATWTQNLAGSMQTQADRTKDLADRMKDQADQTKTIAEQAKIQALALQGMNKQEKSLVAQSKRSIEATISNEHNSERAWVTATGFILKQDASGQFRVMVNIANTGKTPAVDVSADLKLSFGVLGEFVPRRFSQPPKSQYQGKSILAPGKVSTIEIYGSANLDQQGAYKDEALQIFIDGIIRYKDVSGQQHWTTICDFHTAQAPESTFPFYWLGNDIDRTGESPNHHDGRN